MKCGRGLDRGLVANILVANILDAAAHQALDRGGQSAPTRRACLTTPGHICRRTRRLLVNPC
jgi:hypothetical protein